MLREIIGEEKAILSAEEQHLHWQGYVADFPNAFLGTMDLKLLEMKKIDSKIWN